MHTPGGNPPKCGYESWLSATESLQQDVYAVCGILLATGEINMGNRVTQFCLRALPILLMMLGIAFLLFCVIQFWNLRDGVNDKTALGKLLSQGKGDEYISAKLDLYNRRADDIKTLLVYQLAIGGFITALQGLFAFFNVQNFTKQADDAMKKGNETVTKLESQGNAARRRVEVIASSAAKTESKAQRMLKSIEAQMPVFTQMDRVINAAVEQLQLLFREPDTLTDLYDTILPTDRQRITYYERSVAGLEFAELPQLKTKLANVYRGLAVFYASKCFKDLDQLKEKRWSEGPDVDRIRDKEDLTRARLYAEMARAKSENPFCVENDLGWMASRDGDLCLAAEHCRRSLALQPCQQRALTNLGITQLKQNNLAEAVVTLSRAKQLEIWETDRKDLKSRVHYNLACTLVRQAMHNTTQEEKLLAEALWELNEMLKYNTRGLLTCFDSDLKEDGDLHFLADKDRRGIASIREAMTT